ncbi:endonuclease/exonuclease/phosphatase family protein [Colwellia echini]|uniref:Endonuclease/exonuclease/phosphatase family protein n=1 Tax=Colwellia echini TaxID=1982103 RepID=A0ABY3MZ43_9GAMM|nr:endonuclease/exonuclease/phosphatase family protein [Colwellia echini]TYK66282.1 endonuclease/exonuclease/phosphatase family protein [Colwellia echini]
MIKSRYNTVESLKIMGDASKDFLGPNINILLWNVFKCKKTGWLEDFITLTENKDLVLLQEAVVNSPFDNHFNLSKQHQWIMARSFRDIQTNIETGVKTGSTVATQDHYCSASKHAEPISNTKKMLLKTVYPLCQLGQDNCERSLLVVNTHLINFVSFEKFKDHLDQIFKTLANHKGPMLLAGDFNTWNRKRLKYFKSLALSFSLTEVKMIRQPKVGHLLQHLDHIYYRGIEITNVQVHTDINTSDHYPISLSVRID